MNHNLTSMFVSVVYALALSLSIPACSSHRTTTTTSEVEAADSDRARYAPESGEPQVVERTETTTVERRSDGGVFSILGDIIALPFRAVGALFSAIF